MSGRYSLWNAPPRTPAGTLVDRESQLSRLTGLLRDPARGTGSAVPIEGEPQVSWGTATNSTKSCPLLPFLIALKVEQPDTSARRNAIAAMLRGLTAGGKPDAPLLRLTNSAAGNPFYVTGIIGALAERRSDRH
jgi:hypothetical protein